MRSELILIGFCIVGLSLGACSTKRPLPKPPSYSDQFKTIDHVSIKIIKSDLDDIINSALLDIYESITPNTDDPPVNALQIDLEITGKPYSKSYCAYGCYGSDSGPKYEAGYEIKLKEIKTSEHLSIISYVNGSYSPVVISIPFYKASVQEKSKKEAIEELLGGACGSALKMFPNAIPLKAISSNVEYVNKACLEWLDFNFGFKDRRKLDIEKMRISLAVIHEPDYPPSAKVRASQFILPGLFLLYSREIFTDEDDAIFKAWLYGANTELQTVGANLYRHERCAKQMYSEADKCYAQSVQVLLDALETVGTDAREAILKRLYSIKDYPRKFEYRILGTHAPAIKKALSGWPPPQN